MAASEFRHVAAMGAGRFLRDGDGNARIQGTRIAKPKADLLEIALKARGPLDREAFSERLARSRHSLTPPETALLEDLARRPLDDASDREFEALASDVLTTMAVTPSSATSAVSRSPEQQPPPHRNNGPKQADETPPSGPEDQGRLRALLDAASRNRRAVVERAARKEAEFNAARQAAIAASERVKREAAKTGLQVGIAVLTRRGRVAPTGLTAAIADHREANARAEQLLQELDMIRSDIGEWDEEIRGILARMKRGKPVG